jgi:hypothetical protein
MQEPSHSGTFKPATEQIFSGNIYIFHAFDVGDDINLEKIQQTRPIPPIPLSIPKYFTNYHKPIAIKPPHLHPERHALSCKIHNFGAISLTYQIPVSDTLENIRKDFDRLNMVYYEQSLLDVKFIYDKIHPCIMKPKFFQTRSSYTVLQVNPHKEIMDITLLQKQYGNMIASILRFEIESLSEYQKNEILDSAIGYFRGDLIIVDTDAAFVYDDEYKDLLDLFEFANIQQLELRYFDRQLDQQLNKIYEGSGRKPPLLAYLPFIGTNSDPIDELGKLKVDISVIAERLEGSIKLAGEPYYSELYELLVKKLDLKNWHDSIDRKLSIVHDIQTVYQEKIDVIREDMLSVLIIVLIFIELVIGILNLFK